MNVYRTIRHLCATRAGTRRRFDSETEAAIAANIREMEARTSGEIRFAVETAFDLPELWRGVTPRERAVRVFAELGVWDTELRNGVLIYVMAADRDVEIVVDRGAARLIAAPEWEAACHVMEEHFHAGRFSEGAVAGICAVGELLARHFPTRSGDRDELPNQPVLL